MLHLGRASRETVPGAVDVATPGPFGGAPTAAPARDTPARIAAVPTTRAIDPKNPRIAITPATPAAALDIFVGHANQHISARFNDPGGGKTEPVA